MPPRKTAFSTNEKPTEGALDYLLKSRMLRGVRALPKSIKFREALGEGFEVSDFYMGDILGARNCKLLYYSGGGKITGSGSTALAFEINEILNRYGSEGKVFPIHNFETARFPLTLLTHVVSNASAVMSLQRNKAMGVQGIAINQGNPGLRGAVNFFINSLSNVEIKDIDETWPQYLDRVLPIFINSLNSEV